MWSSLGPLGRLWTLLERKLQSHLQYVADLQSEFAAGCSMPSDMFNLPFAQRLRVCGELTAEINLQQGIQCVIYASRSLSRLVIAFSLR